MQGQNESTENERARLLEELAELRRFYKAVCYHSHNEARYIHFAKAVEREMKRTSETLARPNHREQLRRLTRALGGWRYQ